MADIILPEPLRASLGPEMGMDYHCIDVRLVDGRIFRQLMVRGGRAITGRLRDSFNDGPLPFEASNIAEIRRWSLVLPARWWFLRPAGAPVIPASRLAILLALAVLLLPALIISHWVFALPAALATFLVAVLIGLRRRDRDCLIGRHWRD